MTKRRWILVVALFVIGAGVAVLLAADIPLSGTPTPDKPRAPMEFFGLGPEMFADRGKAWIEALGVVIETGIAKLGVILLAAYALKKNLNSQKESKADVQAVKDELGGRLDRHDRRLEETKSEIQQVALAVPATVTPTP